MTHFPLPLIYVEIEIEKFSEADALPLPSWDNARFKKKKSLFSPNLHTAYV